MPSPIRVAVTGAAGNIGYALVYRIANGDLFGPNQPVMPPGSCNVTSFSPTTCPYHLER